MKAGGEQELVSDAIRSLVEVIKRWKEEYASVAWESLLVLACSSSRQDIESMAAAVLALTQEVQRLREVLDVLSRQGEQHGVRKAASSMSAVLEGLVRHNERLIAEGKASLFWKSSKPFVYRASAKEEFWDALLVQERGFGDMPDLCAWYAASLRASGLDSAARCHLVDDGRSVRVRLSGGDIVEPTGEIVSELRELLQQVQGLGEALERPDGD
jgi:hypothetical protein